MEIYGDEQSGNCLKVKYVADKLGIDYDWMPIDIMQGESRTDSFLTINPHGQVPVVVWSDGRTLAQSNAILRYLAQGSSLLPPDTFKQAQIDQWLFWEQYNHEPYVAVCRFHMVYKKQSKETREAWRVERGEQALDTMERQLTDQQWIASDDFSIADISLFAYTRVAEEGGFDLSSRPLVQRWIDNCENQLAL